MVYTKSSEVKTMPKAVRIIALIMAILMGVSAIGMIAMYISAETCEGIGISASLSSMEKENESCVIATASDLALFASAPCLI